MDNTQATSTEFPPFSGPTKALPRAIRRQGTYALRKHGEHGYILWQDFRVDGQRVSVQAGAVSNPENFEVAVDAAEEEMRCLMAEAQAEFGF